MKRTDIIALEARIKQSPFAETQRLINSGSWSLEYTTTVIMAKYLELGACMLGETEATDFYGNKVPSRYTVETGTIGSPEYVAERFDKILNETLAKLN